MSSPKKIAVGGIIHETNTYSTEFMGQTQLGSFEVYRGADILRAFEGANHQVGGFIDGIRRADAEIAWTYLAQCTPSGTISRAAYEAMKHELLDAIARQLPVDGVLLALHGAGVADGTPDLEGDICVAVRELVGPDVPIGAAYDLHGNLTRDMVRSCELTIPCRLYPHTDFLSRGVECAELLIRVIEGGVRPVVRARQLPMLQYIAPTGAGSTQSAINDLCEEMQAIPGVLECSWFHGFPLADVEAPCPAIVCITDGDEELAATCVKRVASSLWAKREELKPEVLSPAEAVKLAFSSYADRPIVIADYADNPGGGAPGDGTALLAALIAAAPSPGEVCFGTINDAQTVRAAIEGGVGSTIEVSLGGKQGRYQGSPVTAKAYVKTIVDGRFVNRPGAMFAGVKFDIGPKINELRRGVDVLVASRAEQVYDEIPFLLCGIDVNQYKIVALKGANHFRAAYEAIAGRIISADSGGLSSSRLAQFARDNKGFARWPVDDAARQEGDENGFVRPGR